MILEKALGPDHSDVASTLDHLSALYGAQNLYADAEILRSRALSIREKALGPNHPKLAITLNNLAVLQGWQGRFVEALTLSTRAVAILSKHLSPDIIRRSVGTNAQQLAYRSCFTNYVWIADSTAEIKPDRRTATALETFRVAQMSHASGTGLAVAAMAARLAAGSDALAAVVREHQDLSDRWRRLDAEIVRAVSRLPAERDPAAEASLRVCLDDIAQRLNALDSRIAAEFPDYAELSNPQPLRADVTQGLLAPDEGLVVYLSSRENTWVWVVRHDHTFFTRTNISSGALADEVIELRVRLDPNFNPDLKAFPVQRAYALYQKILAPVMPLLVGANRIIVVPDGALQSLPFGVLVTQPPERDPRDPGEYRSIAWLARDRIITVLPSVSCLQSLRQHGAPSKATAPLLGIGDPVLQGPRRQEHGAMLASLLEKVRELPPLPETEKGLRAIACVMGATEDDLLLGERASEPMLRGIALDRYKVIAFATHGLVAGELEDLAEPALVLTPPAEASPENDGLLTASKIATLKLDADWVVLSACNTAAGDGTPNADGLTGLAKAFFYAGARSLLVSHWPVWSKPTVALTTRAFAELARQPSIGRAEALQLSMMAMLHPSNPSEFAHPQVWAPFVLVGEGGRAR
jgi:CHAT domain-containing protein